MKKTLNGAIIFILIFIFSFQNISAIEFEISDIMGYAEGRSHLSRYSSEQFAISSKNKLFTKSDLTSMYNAASEGKINILKHFSEINMVKTLAQKQLETITDDERKSRALIQEIEFVEEYIAKLTEILVDKENDYQNMEIFSHIIANRSLNPESLDSFMLLPLLSAYMEAYQTSGLNLTRENYRKIGQYVFKIGEAASKGIFEKIFAENKFDDENLLSICYGNSKSVRVVYFDRESGKFISKHAFPGTIIGNVKIRAIYDDSVALFNLTTQRSVVKKFFPKHSSLITDVDFHSIPSSYRIVPWFGEDYKYTVKKTGKLTIYMKVIDEKGLTLKNVSLNIDGVNYQSDSDGKITMAIDTERFNTGEHSFTVSLNQNVKADFNVNIEPRDMVINYSASVGLSAGVGLEPVVAGANVAVKPNIDGTITFFAPDIMDRRKDKVIYNLFPSLSGSFSASLGPKIKPLDVKIMSYNLGAGAGATVGASASVKGGFSTQYLYNNPYTREGLKAQTIFLVDKLLYFNGPFQPIMSRLIQKFSGVRINDYQIYAGLSISGNVGVSGNISGTLGLVDNDNKVKFGGQATVVSGSANLGTGVDAGILGGFTIFGPTDDKYNVALKSSLSGNFSALEFQSKIFGKDIIPAWWLVNVNGSVNTNLIFRFDENFRLTKSMVIFSMGYRFRPNIYNYAVEYLKENLKKDGARAEDYAELSDIRGMTKVYIFVIDREKTEKYFGEWAAFSRTLLTERNPQNEQTVVAKVKGLFGAVSESFSKLAETPVMMIEKTDLILDYYEPTISFDVSLGVRVKLGIDTSFSKTKTFTDRVGYFSAFNFYPIEEYGYNKEIARADREITYLMNEIGGYVADEVKDGASYVFKKAKDGSIQIAQKVSDNLVYVITVAADGTASMAQKVGKAAKDTWNSVVGAVGTAAEYVYDAGATAANAVGNALSNAWNYWFK